MVIAERSPTRSVRPRKARSSHAKSSPRPGPSVTEEKARGRVACGAPARTAADKRGECVSRESAAPCVANCSSCGCAGIVPCSLACQDRPAASSARPIGASARSRGSRARLALFHEAPVLRGDGARVHPVGQVIDRAAGDRRRPRVSSIRRRRCRDGAAAATGWKPMPPRRAAGERLAADARVAVRGDDEVGPFGDRVGRDELRIVVHLHVRARRSAAASASRSSAAGTRTRAMSTPSSSRRASVAAPK